MWQDFVGWLQSSAGARVLQTTIIPVLAIVVAAVVAALIARAAVRASIRRSERVEASSAIGALVAAAGVGGGSDDEYVRRLRAEADVRTRLLPLPGAGMAADWAAARFDAAQHGSTTGAGTDELRDRLVEWVEKPSRAKRLFAAPQAKPAPAARPEAKEQKAEPKAPAVERADADAAEPERFARPAVAAHRTPAPEVDAPAAVAAPIPEPAVPTVPAAVPAEVAPAAAVAQPAAEVPAWQRTRAGERLQQERTRPRATEPAPADEDDVVPLSTAPVQLMQAHRAQAATADPATDSDEAVRLEAHQQARHARPDQAPAAAAKGSPPAATPAPAWLDTYDDEAQVTQNLDLKTPPPVAAATIRDRGTGEDLVPRS